MSSFRELFKKLPLISVAALIAVGVSLFFRVFFKVNPSATMVLFLYATAAMYVTIKAWGLFTPTWGPKIIYWTSTHKYIRKIIAGGSFSYYEYKEDQSKIGMFEPISRFINLMIAFLGLTTSISKAINFLPKSPVEDGNSMLAWSMYLMFVPLILTPIIPVIWTMEDLGLKAWNKKTRENWRVSIRYKKRFNSFITVGTLSVGLGLTGGENLTFQENLLIFGNILLNGVILLIYPVAVLTLLYYLQFKGTVNKEVRSLMNIPTSKTELIEVDPITGKRVLTPEERLAELEKRKLEKEKARNADS